jgi:hypothetical protein
MTDQPDPDFQKRWTEEQARAREELLRMWGKDPKGPLDEETLRMLRLAGLEDASPEMPAVPEPKPAEDPIDLDLEPTDPGYVKPVEQPGTPTVIPEPAQTAPEPQQPRMSRWQRFKRWYQQRQQRQAEERQRRAHERAARQAHPAQPADQPPKKRFYTKLYEKVHDWYAKKDNKAKRSLWKKVGIAAGTLAATAGLAYLLTRPSREETVTMTYKGKEWVMPAKAEDKVRYFMRTADPVSIDYKLIEADCADGTQDYRIKDAGVAKLR